jgi:hypothetical protein
MGSKEYSVVLKERAFIPSSRRVNMAVMSGILYLGV